MESFIAFQCLRIMKIVDSCVPTYHLTYEAKKRVPKQKIRLNKRNTYFFKMFFIIWFFSIFPLQYVKFCAT